ncbi:MAG: hypothetical protein M3088_06595, partial [Actinomycetota bacterium]|nr:hypothetical protein [Actinomycetota bacterium]
ILGRLGAIDERVDSMLVAADRFERSSAKNLAVGERLEAGLPSVTRIGDSIDDLGRAATTLAAAVEPLQGLAERFGAFAERLPGLTRPRPIRPEPTEPPRP